MTRDVVGIKKLKLPNAKKRQLEEPPKSRKLSVKVGFKPASEKAKAIETTEVEVITDSDLEFIPNSRALKLGSKNDAEDFLTRTRVILERLDAERNESAPDPDADILYEFYKLTLADTLEMIPKAKNAYMRYPSQPNANSYNALVTKCQELIADIQALSSKGDLLERIITTSINPSFMAIISNVSNSYVDFKESFQKLEFKPGQEDLQQSILALVALFARSTALHMQEVQKGLQADLIGKMGDGN